MLRFRLERHIRKELGLKRPEWRRKRDAIMSEVYARAHAAMDEDFNTPEALAVSMLDNLDAKMHMALSATRWGDAGAPKDAELGGHFTEKVWPLATRLYRPDPTKLDEEE